MHLEISYIREEIYQKCDVNMKLWINDLGSAGLEKLDSYLKTYINCKLIKT